MDRKIALMALWRHDTYPGFLMGNVTSMDERGYVETVEFGPGKFFQPCLLLPADRYDGLSRVFTALREKKQELEAKHIAELHNLKLLTLPGEVLASLGIKVE